MQKISNERFCSELEMRQVIFDAYKAHQVPDKILFDPTINEVALTGALSFLLKDDKVAVTETNWRENELKNRELNRLGFIFNFGQTLISKEWVQPLVRYIGTRRCLEVGCGSGQLTFALRKYGASVIPTDDFTWENPTWWKRQWIDDVKNMDAIEAVKAFGRDIDIIIMSWPPYDTPMALNVLIAAREFRLPIIYIGETNAEYACTGGVDFLQQAKFLEVLKANNGYQSWEGIHDIITLVE